MAHSQLDFHLLQSSGKKLEKEYLLFIEISSKWVNLHYNG